MSEVKVKATDYEKEIKKYKKQVLSMLSDMNLLDAADEASLNILFDNYRVYLMARDQVFNDGCVIDGVHGKVPHPGVSQMIQASKAMIAIMKEFGVSAKSRASMMTESGVEPESPLNKFLSEVSA